MTTVLLSAVEIALTLITKVFDCAQTDIGPQNDIGAQTDVGAHTEKCVKLIIPLQIF